MMKKIGPKGRTCLREAEVSLRGRQGSKGRRNTILGTLVLIFFVLIIAVRFSPLCAWDVIGDFGNLQGGNTWTGDQNFTSGTIQGEDLTVDSLSLSADTYGLAKPVNWYLSPSYTFPPLEYVTSNANWINYAHSTTEVATIYYLNHSDDSLYTTSGTKTYTIDSDAAWKTFTSTMTSAAYKADAHYTARFTEFTGVNVIASSAPIAADGSDYVLQWEGDTTASKAYRLSFLTDGQETHAKKIGVQAYVKFPTTGGHSSVIGVGISGEGTTIATNDGVWIGARYDASGNIIEYWHTVILWQGDTYYYHTTTTDITSGYHMLQLELTSVDGVNLDTWNAYVDGVLIGTQADAPDGWPALTMINKSIDTWTGDVHGCLYSTNGAAPVAATNINLKFLNQYRTP